MKNAAFFWVWAPPALTTDIFFCRLNSVVISVGHDSDYKGKREDTINERNGYYGWSQQSSHMTSFPEFGLSRITSAGFWLYVLITILPIVGQNFQHDLHHKLQVICADDP